jgi:hypothetical protein
MNSAIALENPATVIGGEYGSHDESNSTGNVVYTVEVSNVFVGSAAEIIEDIVDSQIAAVRMQEETEPMDKVFSELGIA